jgi:hypothetical protein
MGKIFQLCADITVVLMFLWGILQFLWGKWKVVLQLNSILAEVKPNGGNSLKDRVMKLELSQKEQLEVLGEQTKQLERIEKKINDGHKHDQGRVLK